MQAIQTKYHGPTNTKGSRISATCADGRRVYISYPHEIGGDMERHEVAARALCEKLGWIPERLEGGALKDGYAFLMLGRLKVNELRNRWIFIIKKGEYYFYVTRPGSRLIYQVTKDGRPPTNKAGYFSTSAICEAKKIGFTDAEEVARLAQRTVDNLSQPITEK